MREVVALIGVAVLWICALGSVSNRNWRFVGFMVCVTIAVASVPALPAAFRSIAIVGIAGVAFVGFFGARRLRLSSFTQSDDSAWKALEQLDAALDDPAGPRRARAMTAPLGSGPFSVPDGPWAITGRLFRLLVARATEPEPSMPETGFTPVWAYRRAADDYARLTYFRRVIGRDHRPSRWDEEMLLRSFGEELHRLIKADEQTPSKLMSTTEAERAERIIQDVTDVELVHPTSQRLRSLFIEWMWAALAVARDGPTREALDRRETTAAAAAIEWPTLAPADPWTP